MTNFQNGKIFQLFEGHSGQFLYGTTMHQPIINTAGDLPISESKRSIEENIRLRNTELRKSKNKTCGNVSMRFKR